MILCRGLAPTYASTSMIPQEKLRVAITIDKGASPRIVKSTVADPNGLHHTLSLRQLAGLFSMIAPVPQPPSATPRHAPPVATHRN